MTDFIRDDKGVIIGKVEDQGSTLTYSHIKYGVIGQYRKTAQQYVRFRKELGIAYPLSREDYGRSDVITFNQMLNQGLIK